jgi:hypothetical protein
MIQTLVTLTAVLLMSIGPIAQATPPPTESAASRELYRFAFLQAAPGKLPDLIALCQKRAAAMVTGGDERPIAVRHSQGDRWDLLIIWPVGNLGDYYSRERTARRDGAATAGGLSTDAFARQLYDLVAWHEDVFMQGPPLSELRAYVTGATLAHLEILQALAGKRDELVRERERESTFNVERGRPRMLIFTHEQGASWDVVTLDAWRDWRHYGELMMVPAAVSDAAARKAGFANADAVGVYMRSLIATHHDTLGGLIPLAPPQ